MNSSSNANTVLIVILILLVVGFGAYWYNDRQAGRVEDNTPELQINI